MTFERKTTQTIGANTKPMTVVIRTDSEGYPMGNELPDARCCKGEGSVYLKNRVFNESFTESGYIVECSLDGGCEEGLTWDGAKTIVWNPFDPEKMVVES